MKITALPKPVQEALKEFDDAAQDHGYLASEGSAEAAFRAEERYLAAEEKLVRSIVNAIRAAKRSKR